MTAAVETMAYANEVPWHGLGTNVDDKLTPAQMLKVAGLDWTVSKRELFLKGGVKVPGKFALCRDKDDAILSVVGATYKPVQNEEALDFFKKFVNAGHMKMETAGSLHGGKFIWGLAKIGKDFKLGGKDEITGHLLLMQPHKIGQAMVIQFTPVRVVCWNTLNFALGSGLRGKITKLKSGREVHAFRNPHCTEFTDSVKKRAEEALGLAEHHMDEFKQAAELLVKKRAKPEEVTEFFCEVLKFDPKKKKDDEREPRALGMFQDALEKAPGQQLTTALGTWWGAVNAVTYVCDHSIGRERDTALANAWLGHQSTVKRRAVELALKRAA